jgi:hypothetical protein
MAVFRAVYAVGAESQHRTMCLKSNSTSNEVGSFGSRNILGAGQADNQSSNHNKPKSILNVYYIFVALAAGEAQPQKS